MQQSLKDIENRCAKLSYIMNETHTIQPTDEAAARQALDEASKQLDIVSKIVDKYRSHSKLSPVQRASVEKRRSISPNTKGSILVSGPLELTIASSHSNDSADEADDETAERFFADTDPSVGDVSDILKREAEEIARKNAVQLRPKVPQKNANAASGSGNKSNNHLVEIEDDDPVDAFDEEDDFESAMLQEAENLEESFFNESKEVISAERCDKSKEAILLTSEAEVDSDKTDDDATDPNSDPSSLNDFVADGPQPDPMYLTVLKKYFGHSSFRPLQWRIIDSILNKKQDNCVVMSTGYGKSVCYQYPSVFTGKTSVVISPLISLMSDQVMALKAVNIPANFLGSAQDRSGEVRQAALEGKYRIIYLTPEFITTDGCSFMQTLHNRVGLDLVAVDEAHCVTVWGHDFRSAYRGLAIIRDKLPQVPLMALTATATPKVERDICSVLKLKNPVITRTGFDRPNLYLTVEHKSNITSDLCSKMRKTGNTTYEFDGPTIVYCPTRKSAEEVCNNLCAHGVKAGLYHAAISNKQKQSTHNKFLNDELQVVVATVAFGMGIDKADIRKVIHYGAPKDIESYYQEIGRGGRDGQPSTCHIFFTSGDFVTTKFLLQKDITNQKYLEHRLQLLQKLENEYLKSRSCRRRAILRHFEDPSSEAVGMTYNCCDNCRRLLMAKESGADVKSLTEKQEYGPVAFDLLSTVELMNSTMGLASYVKFLHGSFPPRAPQRHMSSSLFGKYKGSKDEPQTLLKALGKSLKAEGYLTEESFGPGSFAYIVKLTKKGEDWLMRNQQGKPSMKLMATDDMIPKSKMPTVKPTFASAGTSMDSSQRQPVILGQVPTAKWMSSSDWKTQVTKQQSAAAISAEEMKLVKELLSVLIKLRDELATDLALHSVNIFANKILQDMAKFRPSNKEKMLQLDGVATERVTRYGDNFVEAITKFSQENNLELDSFPKPPEVKRQMMPGMESQLSCLTNTVRESYELFELNGNSLEITATQRGYKTGTIVSHLCTALDAGLPLDIARLGVTDRVQNVIEETIRKPPINSQIDKLTPIKEQCPEDITFDHIKVVLAIMRQKYGIAGGGSCLNAAASSTSSQLSQFASSFSQQEASKRPLPPSFFSSLEQKKQKTSDKMKHNKLFSR